MAWLFGHLGRRERADRRTGPARAVALVVAAALVLASCTDYKARLRAPDAPDAPGAPSEAGLVPPEPAEQKRSVWQGEKVTGWVHLRFDVSAAGEARDIAVVRSSDEELEARAVGKLAAWPFVPASRDGAAQTFQDLELVMVFYTDDTTTTAEAIGITLLVIILVPVALVLAVLSGGGKFECCSN